ncbi:unnamed protein product [Rhizophagus irregularis]|nr:unnamed protein product [Rhizophagus irregularis]
MSLNNNENSTDIIVLKELLKDFYRHVIFIEDYNNFENIITERIKEFIKYNKKTPEIILKLMEDHEENENWFSSLIGFFHEYGIGVIKIDKNKSLELYLLTINNENKKLISLYQILNIIIAKYLLSFHYYKDILLNKRNLIFKKIENLNNIHIMSQIHFENFNGLEINLCKDEIINMEKYFESLDKDFNDNKNDNQIDYIKKKELVDLNNLAYYYQYGIGKEKNEFKAFEFYLNSSEKEGNSDAQNNLGCCYQYGIGIEKDESKAFEYYLKAANQGDIYAQYNLGVCYQNGIGVNKDDEKAFEWYFKSAEGELSIAQNVLGNCYSNGIGIEKDKNKAFECYLKVAKRGNSNAADIALGDCYKNGIGTSKNEYKAFECYLRAAKRGNSDAENNLGDLYKSGNRIKNLNQAIYWYKKSAEKGNAIAQYNLGNCYRFGKGVEKDLFKAFEFYEKSSNNGYLNAQFELGYCYSNGFGTVLNIEKACELYKIAAEKGHNNAQYNLSLLLYSPGEGINKVEKDLFEKVEKLAEEGCLDSQNQLGYYYNHGIGTKINKEMAFELYKIVAEKDHSIAQNNLGDLYKNDEEFKKAFYWYNKAAEDSNNIIAQYNVGQCYELGIGVDKNYSKAFNYYQKSYDLDHLESYFQLGYCYINGLGTKIKRKKGLELYNEAVGKDKKFNILSYYENEDGINNDLDKVLYWYYKAAENDNKVALYKLGKIYETGKGVYKNITRANAFYKQAAELGYCHENENEPHNDKKVINPYEKTAESKNDCTETHNDEEVINSYKKTDESKCIIM